MSTWDTFTDTEISGRPRSRQLRLQRQTPSQMNLSRSGMKPYFSSTGTKAEGGTIWPLGLIQRASDSAPTMLPVDARTWGCSQKVISLFFKASWKSERMR